MVNGDSSTRTNNHGIALVTSATPYRQNNFHLEQDGTKSSDVDLQGNLLNIAPYEGSITYLKYKTDTRKVFMLDVQDSNGDQLPFGALVSDNQNQELGYVSQGSQMFIKSDTMPDTIRINTSKGKLKRSCVIMQPKENATNICR